MMQIKNKVVMVTGASKGIGRSLAIEFVKNGAITVLAARSVGELKKLESILKSSDGKVFSVFLDLTSKKSIESTVKEVIGKYGKIDVLVNNAGVGLFDNISDSKSEDIKKLFETNFFGPLFLIQNVLPYMRKRKTGMIVNISSAISKHSLFHQGIYSASKAALERITEALSIEEHKNGIKTLLVIPDRTKTNFRDNVLGNKKFAKLPFKLPESSPDLIAKKIVKSIIKGKSIYYTSLRSRIYTAASGLCPQLINKIFKKSYKKFITSLK